MKIFENHKIDKRIKEYSQLSISRRRFLKGTLAVGAMSQIVFLQSCVNEILPPNDILTKKQYQTVITVQNILFPKDKNGPGASDFNAHEYLIWVLSDNRLDPEDNQYIIDGIRWIEESAEEHYSKSFLKLSESKQEELILKVSKENWGESWLSVILNFIFEAMISDPLYGFNNDSIGWKWLDHQVGNPRPTKELLYDKIFKTVQKNS